MPFRFLYVFFFYKLNMNSDKVIPVKVALRIRPLVPKELADACAECLRTLGEIPQVNIVVIILK